MTFNDFLLIEGAQGMLKALADDVVNQFADEGRWNHDEMLQVVRKRLEEMPEFQHQPRKLDAALAAVSHYLSA